MKLIDDWGSSWGETTTNTDWALEKKREKVKKQDGSSEESRSHRRTIECTELTTKYQYRRAFSEVSLLHAMRYEELKNGHSYNFITAGDVDSLSYLKIVLNKHNLDHLLCSTWCMAAEDIYQLTDWYKQGRVKQIDIYVGEIFPTSYTIEFEMLQRFYRDNPEAGRLAVFRNHSKIYAGFNESEDFYFGIQTSANINTNPRTENGNITIDRGLYEFYKEYFDGINSFV